LSFVETIERARALLERSGRISLRVLQREFGLDETALEDLIEELVDVQQVAAREGKVLAWLGAARPVAATPAESEEVGERRQLTVLFCDLVGSTELAATARRSPCASASIPAPSW
jgi:class 3 adenylate cyclase